MNRDYSMNLNKKKEIAESADTRIVIMNILVRIKSEDSEKEINLHDWTSKNTCIRDKCYLLQVFRLYFDWMGIFLIIESRSPRVALSFPLPM